MTASIPYKSYSGEEVDSNIDKLNDPNTIVEGLQNLNCICSDAMVIFHPQSANIILEIIQNNSENTDIIDQTLVLLENILKYEQMDNVSLFSTDEFLHIFFTYINSKSTLYSLFYIVSSNISSAHSILEHLMEGSLISPDSLLSPMSYNLEFKIHFLSAFLKYEDDEFIEFISQILETIFELSRSRVRPTVRTACRYFLKDALSVNSSLVDMIAYHPLFVTTFQSPPESREERILILNLLRIVSSLTRDAMTIIVNNNLLPFVCISMRLYKKKIETEEEEENNDKDKENSYFDITCAALDVIREIAYCGESATEILYQNGIVDEIWDFMDDQNQYNVKIAAIMAILEIVKYSTIEERNSMVKEGLFEIIGQNFDTIPDCFLELALTNIKDIIDISESESNEFLLNALFEAQTLMEKLEELSIDNEEQMSPIAFEIIKKKK